MSRLGAGRHSTGAAGLRSSTGGWGRPGAALTSPSRTRPRDFGLRPIFPGRRIWPAWACSSRSAGTTASRRRREVTSVSRPDHYIGVDFAPALPPNRVRRPLVALVLVLLALGSITVAVTQLLLR